MIDAILDEGVVCFVGIAAEASPVVIPMAYGRRGDELILHGAQASRLLRAGAAGTPLCVTVTLIDGLVLARSAFHHSLNYRSVVLFGVARELTDGDEKAAALAAVVEHLLPGRFAAVRPPNAKELAATRVLAVPIDTASAKRRTGGPLDDAEDEGWPCWAGEIPLVLTAQPPRPTTQGTPPGGPPASVRDYQPGKRFASDR
ncbi:MAG: pyridoxamine 5'-phosphate oxidase family protein [Polyangia bacterium]